MRKGYSVIKRGKTYFLYHRKNPEKKLVGVSLKTPELQEAHRRAKIKVAELDAALAIANLPDPFEGVSDTELQNVVRSWITGLDKKSSGAYNQQVMEMQLEKQKEEEEHGRIQREIILDAENPRLDQIWTLASASKNDSGYFINWAKLNRTSNTIIHMRTAWKHFRTLMPHIIRMDDITPKAVRDFENKLIKAAETKKAKNISEYVRNVMIPLQGIVSTAVNQGWIAGPNNVKMSIEYNRKKDRAVEFLSEGDVDKIRKAAGELEDKNALLFIEIAVHTGMRRDEIINLRWEDLDFTRRLVKVQAKSEDKEKGIFAFQTKSKQTRSIPMKKELINVLLPYQKESGYVLSSRAGRLSLGTLTNHLKKVQQKSGVKFHPHLFRHTFASWAATKGVSIYKIQKWLGHSSVQITTDIYAHLQNYDEDIDRF